MTSPAQRREFERRFGLPWPERFTELEAELAEERRHHARCEAEYAAPKGNDCETDGQRRRRMALSKTES